MVVIMASCLVPSLGSQEAVGPILKSASEIFRFSDEILIPSLEK